VFGFFGVLPLRQAQGQNDSKTCSRKFKCKDEGHGWVMVSFPPIANCAMDGAPLSLVAGEEEQATAKACLRLGEDRGREADFSASRLTMRL
jgi:hypothetical protein